MNENEPTAADVWEAAIKATAQAMHMPTGNAEDYLRRQGLNDEDVARIAAARPADQLATIKRVTTAAYERQRQAGG